MERVELKRGPDGKWNGVYPGNCGIWNVVINVADYSVRGKSKIYEVLMMPRKGNHVVIIEKINIIKYRKPSNVSKGF